MNVIERADCTTVSTLTIEMSLAIGRSASCTYTEAALTASACEAPTSLKSWLPSVPLTSYIHSLRWRRQRIEIRCSSKSVPEIPAKSPAPETTKSPLASAKSQLTSSHPPG